MIWLLRRRRARPTGDAGFTLIEIVVSMVITLIVMSALLGVFVSSLSSVSLAKQRQSATALATQVMEQLRALPYDTVTASTTSTAPTGDPNVEYVTPANFKPTVIAGLIEPLVVNTQSPKSRTQSLDGVDYTVRQYVSKAAGSGTSQPAFSLTAIVSYTSNASNGLKTTVERSSVYSPTGCLSTATRPFSGPCQAYYTAQAGQASANINVAGAADPTAAIPGFSGSGIELVLPTLSTNLLLEQTTTATAGVATTEGRAGSGTSGGKQASAAVDSDPSSAGTLLPPQSTPTQTAAPQTLSGTVGTLTVTPSTSDAGVARAAVAADTAICVGTAGTALTTGSTAATRRPCSSGQVQPSGTAGSIVYQPESSLYGAFSPITVASVAAAPSAARAVAAHLTAANTGTCGATGVGCAYAAAQRSLGDVVVGGLPNAGSPTAFTGSWKVTGLTESAKAESRGTPASASSYTRTGTLSHWNGTGYTTGPITTAQMDITPTPVTASYMTPTGGLLQITVSAVIAVEAPTSTIANPASCQAAACTAQSGALGGIRGQTTYTMTLNGVEQTSFVVSTNLAGLVVQSSYKAAPVA